MLYWTSEVGLYYFILGICIFKSLDFAIQISATGLHLVITSRWLNKRLDWGPCHPKRQIKCQWHKDEININNCCTKTASCERSLATLNYLLLEKLTTCKFHLGKYLEFLIYLIKFWQKTWCFFFQCSFWFITLQIKILPVLKTAPSNRRWAASGMIIEKNVLLNKK